MRQTEAIHRALKRVMREQRKTYAEAATVLQLSEASVKRLLSGNGLSLQRLERLCDWLCVDVGEVVALSAEPSEQITQLSAQQEEILGDDEALIMIAFMVLNHWSRAEIIEAFVFTEHQLFRKLVQLERLGLIELLPFDRLKLRVARNFSWNPAGPIQKFFAGRVLKEFLRTRFAEPGEKMHFVSGMLSRASIHKLHALMGGWAKAFDDLLAQDIDLPADERHGVSLLLGFRPWEFSGFTALRRAPRNKFS